MSSTSAACAAYRSANCFAASGSGVCAVEVTVRCSARSSTPTWRASASKSTSIARTRALVLAPNFPARDGRVLTSSTSLPSRPGSGRSSGSNGISGAPKVVARAGVNLDLGVLLQEERHLNFESGFKGRGLRPPELRSPWRPGSVWVISRTTEAGSSTKSTVPS